MARHFTPDACIYDTNHAPVSGRDQIGAFWEAMFHKWHGASWHVDTVVEDRGSAAIEWTMRGHHQGREFTVRGSEHYEFREGLISQIRQYWTFDAGDPGSGLVGYPYAGDRRFA